MTAEEKARELAEKHGFTCFDGETHPMRCKCAFKAGVAALREMAAWQREEDAKVADAEIHGVRGSINGYDRIQFAQKIAAAIRSRGEQ